MSNDCCFLGCLRALLQRRGRPARTEPKESSSLTLLRRGGFVRIFPKGQEANIKEKPPLDEPAGMSAAMKSICASFVVEYVAPVRCFQGAALSAFVGYSSLCPLLDAKFLGRLYVRRHNKGLPHEGDAISRAPDFASVRRLGAMAPLDDANLQESGEVASSATRLRVAETLVVEMRDTDFGGDDAPLPAPTPLAQQLIEMGVVEPVGPDSAQRSSVAGLLPGLRGLALQSADTVESPVQLQNRGRGRAHTSRTSSAVKRQNKDLRLVQMKLRHVRSLRQWLHDDLYGEI